MTILILGGQDDDHATHILYVLKGRGCDVELIDSRWFPSKMRVAFDPAAGAGCIQLAEGRTVDFHAVRSIYWRTYYGVGTPQLPDTEQRFIASNDARSLVETLLQWIPARWVNGWQAYQSHQTKPLQLAQVSALGIRVPATLISNDAGAVRQFADRFRPCIFKPVQGGAHSQRVTPKHLSDSNLLNLRFAPVTLQQEIPGTNLRVFVAGERIACCEIRTEALDFRDDPEPEILPCTLPQTVTEQCFAAARALHLLWTGIDLRRTPAGEHVFLEANPSPMFLGFESRTKLPLTEMLADLLMT